MVNNLMLLELRRLGLPMAAVHTLGLTWANTIHYVKTAYGTSTTTYQNCKEVPLFGPGQGSTLGPFLWLILFTLIATSILPNTPSIHLQSTDGNVSMTDIGEAFVDDSFLGVTSTYTLNPNLCDRGNRHNAEMNTIALLTRLSQQWERLLFAAGGALCLNKSFSYLISWTWNKTGTAKPTTVAFAPGVLSLTSGYDTNSPIDVPRIETTSTYCTLGIRISPSGETKHTFAYLRAQSSTFATKISSSALTRTDAYCTFIPKSVSLCQC
jgi:hypothetical protein